MLTKALPTALRSFVAPVAFKWPFDQSTNEVGYGSAEWLVGKVFEDAVFLGIECVAWCC